MKKNIRVILLILKKLYRFCTELAFTKKYKSLYGKIIVEAKDYTPAAEIYSAISHLLDENAGFDYRDPPPILNREVMFPERMKELQRILEAGEGGYEDADQVNDLSSQTSNTENEEDASGFTTVEADEFPF